MPKYLFTSDQRIGSLLDRIKWVASYLQEGKSLTSISDKSDNNNATTLQSYYNLYRDTEICRQSVTNPLFAIRNFVLKFQFPNTRTSESLLDSIEERTLLAPFRITVRVLDEMASEDSSSYLNLNEILYFIFCDASVFKNPECSIKEIGEKIVSARQKHVDLDSLIERTISWKQYVRQSRELFQVLTYASSCFSLRNGVLRYSKNNASYFEDKEYIELLKSYDKIWYPTDPINYNKSRKEFISYMNTENTPYSVIKVNLEKETHKVVESSFPLQQIYYGAPGTGKSYAVEEVCKRYTHFRTTFHPDSDYSTFVGCYKPSKEKNGLLDVGNVTDATIIKKLKEYTADETLGIVGGLQKCTIEFAEFFLNYSNSKYRELLIAAGLSDKYDVEISKYLKLYKNLIKPNLRSSSAITYSFIPQVFTNAYVEAWKKYKDNEPVFLIIEEINRGNCAQIFGDLFQLLDRNEEGHSSYEIEADTDLQQYIAKQGLDIDNVDDNNGEPIDDKLNNGEILSLPPNLYIWATMNTSDQSLFPIDSAFKRRWDWKYVPISEKKEENYKIRVKDSDGQLWDYDWWDFLEKVNEAINEVTSSEDKKLGYFFCKADKDKKINANKFVGKVLFYLFGDVLKDYETDDVSFTFKGTSYTLLKWKTDDDQGRFKFSEFFNDEGDGKDEMVIKFLENIKVKRTLAGAAPDDDDEDIDDIDDENISLADNTRNASIRMHVKFTDGEDIRIQTSDEYVDVLKKIGLEKAFEVAQTMRGPLGCAFVSKTEEEPILNHQTLRYEHVDEYYIIRLSSSKVMQPFLQRISDQYKLGLTFYRK